MTGEMYEARLSILTQSCVVSNDASFSECFPSARQADNRIAEIIRDIRENAGCWLLVNSNDKSWGRNGIDHIAVNWAKGHMGERGVDDFHKQYARFRWALVHRENYGNPKC